MAKLARETLRYFKRYGHLFTPHKFTRKEMTRFEQLAKRVKRQ